MKRLLAVVAGFVVSVLVGAVVLFFIGSRWAVEQVSTYGADHPDEVTRFMEQTLGMVAFVFTVAPVLTVAPAVAAVLVGELARIRSLLYYVIAGGVAAGLMPLIAAPYEAAENTTYAAPYFTIMATAGFAAGLVYWLVAGRKA